jgi:hypothetical protein
MPTARAELRGGPAGQLPWSPTYSGLQDVTGIIGNNDASQVSTRKIISPKIIRNFDMYLQKGLPSFSGPEHV